MTKRKVITIIVMLILTTVLFTGCTSNQPEPSKPNDPIYAMYAMIRMPDGSIVQGLSSYISFGYCSAVVVIDDVRYQTGAENVVVWR